jgi:small-conductance mechanosensitive channel
MVISNPAPHSAASLLFGIIVGILALLPVPSLAVNLPLKPGSAVQKKQSSSVVPASGTLTIEQIDATIARVQTRVGALRSQSLPEGLTLLASGIPSGAAPEEYQEWRLLTDKIIIQLENRVTYLRILKDTRQYLKDLETQRNGWRGFSEKPPYQLSLTDSLQDAIQTRQVELHTQEMRLVITEGELADYTANLGDSRTRQRLAEEQRDQSIGKPEEARMLWLLALATRRNDLNETAGISLETQRQRLHEELTWLRQEISFLEQKLATASSNFRFTQEELDKKLKELDAQRERLKQELDIAVTTEDYERLELEKIRSSMEQIKSATAAGVHSATVSPRLVAVRFAMEVQQAKVETANVKVLVLKMMNRAILGEQSLWKSRYQLANPGKDAPAFDTSDLKKKLITAQNWRQYIRSRLDGVEISIRSQQDRIATSALTEKERGVARILLAALQEQKSLIVRVEERLTQTEQLLQRFMSEIAVRGGEHRPVTVRLKSHLSDALSYSGKIWNTNLYVAEETVLIDGQKIVRSRSVTVGKVIQALLIFFIGIFVTKKLMVPVQRHAARKFTLNENDAQVFGRVTYYLIFICILIFSLVTVNIPLAVFTFFGGALAIGVGFGAQTLINNFISGLILLFDRSIRLNDVVEVDGQRGRVTAINLRSSRVNRFDGIEILIPNSVFLQQNVVNLTLSDPYTRYEITVGVAYGSPTRTAEEIILRAVVAQPEVRSDPSPCVVFEDFAESSLNFRAFFWVNLDPSINSHIVRSEIRHRISEYLATAEISVPFPQRDLHLNASRPLEVTICEKQ